ncbi:MAG TPA: hypothetical protein DCW59_04635 [Alteromonas sp.]|jgi:NAD(P)H dehydrogenase (quinone)|nr:hypothetical protein [Alteromonas sp.]|tara:strand:+ start:253 stop:483 length:231 start_codon:yes stop_codon:yes gene_type:complete
MVRTADYSSPETLKTALTGVDKLLLISSSEVGQRFSQHRNVIEAAQYAGVNLLSSSFIKRLSNKNACNRRRLKFIA